MKKTPFKREWDVLLKEEKKYRNKRKDGPTSLLLLKLDNKIPKKLRDGLRKAFLKGFQVLFNKGTSLIERTYNKKKSEKDFEVYKYANVLFKDRKSAKQFRRNALKKKGLNIFLSFIEGVVMGVLGLAVPDILIFLSMVLKTVYQIALAYGYDYKDENEQIFLLKAIEISMTDEDEFVRLDEEFNLVIDEISKLDDLSSGFNIDKLSQMEKTTNALVKEMIYTKFIQSIMFIGIFGGVFDPVYINRIANYVELKYRRRFLGKMINEE